MMVSPVILRELPRSVLGALSDQGLNATTVGPSAYAITWDSDTSSYRMRIRTYSYIQPHHLRNMEIAIGARCGAATLEYNDLGWAEMIVIRYP
jgi:hypothetical protein